MHTHDGEHIHDADVRVHRDPQQHQHPHPHGRPREAAPATAPSSEGPLPAELAQLGPTTAGSVVLDIGGDIGSLMILTDQALAGAEIEVSPVGADHQRTHIAIRERRAPGGTRWAGIFPGLLAGRYTVWSVEDDARDVITVVSGEVVELDWRA